MKYDRITVLFLVLSGLVIKEGVGNDAAPIQLAQVYDPVINPADFVDVIDNPYFPLIPGTTFIYEGVTENGSEDNEVAVLNETKQILGVTCVVVRDTVLEDGDLAEQTLDWYAQDKEGNVWYFGEDSKDYENGQVVSTEGSWEAGVDGAKPGIIMKGNPVVGDKYRQEYYEGEAEDMGQVLSLSESVTVPYGSYQNVLMTKDWSALDPDVVEHKYYAKGTGLVLIRYVENSNWTVQLTDIRQQQSNVDYYSFY